MRISNDEFVRHISLRWNENGKEKLATIPRDEFANLVKLIQLISMEK